MVSVPIRCTRNVLDGTKCICMNSFVPKKRFRWYIFQNSKQNTAKERGGRRSRWRPVITHDSVNGRRRRTASAGGMERSGRSPPGPSTAGVHIHVTTTPNSASVKSDRTEKFPSRSRLDYNEQSTPIGRFRRPFAKSASDTRKFSMPVS